MRALVVFNGDNVLPWLMKLEEIEEEATVLNDIRVMERAALDVIHKVTQ